MIDGIIKDAGNSRYAKSIATFKTLYPSYDDFAEALMAGTLPLDLIFNPGGWSQLPTFLNKNNLLKDATAALYGRGSSAVPDEILSDIRKLLDKRAQMAVGTYIGTGTYGADNLNSLTFPFEPHFVFVAAQDRIAYGRSKAFLWVYPSSGVVSFTDSDEDYLKLALLDGNTLSWGSGRSAANQLNAENSTYMYFAAGGGAIPSGRITFEIDLDTSQIETMFTTDVGITWAEFIAEEGASHGLYLDVDGFVRKDRGEGTPYMFRVYAYSTANFTFPAVKGTDIVSPTTYDKYIP